jgi:outer membrane biosynthesis protein TonB
LVFVAIMAVVLGLVFVQWRSSLRASQKTSGPAPVASPPEEQKPKPDTSPTPEATNTPSAAEPSPTPAATSASEKTGQDQPDAAKPSAAATPAPAAEKGNTEDTSPRAAKNAVKKEKAREEPPSLKPSAALLKAQDYLQGRNGVKQDCDQGMTYLRAAVQRSEPAAAMQMGELYASGRCVQQDRVMAYRWMNSAREKVPGNSAIQTTVDQLWGRMTPQERKEAGR